MLSKARVDWIIVVKPIDEHVGGSSQLIGQPLPVGCHPLAYRWIVPPQVQVQQLGVRVGDSALVVDGQEEVGVGVPNDPSERCPSQLFDYVTVCVKQSQRWAILVGSDVKSENFITLLMNETFYICNRIFYKSYNLTTDEIIILIIYCFYKVEEVLINLGKVYVKIQRIEYGNWQDSSEASVHFVIWRELANFWN